MADEQKLRLEIAHVLFVDIVGYSKLVIDEQSEALRDLNEVVLGTNAVRDAEAAGQLIRLPTGDGMALVFTTDAEAPVECAMEISVALRERADLPMRMGIHSGPVNHVVDVNGRENIAGAGINTAQRVMDCGDAGHILLSKRAADDLDQYRRWRPMLHDLGDCEVKHGVRLHLVNLYDDALGNPAVPARIGCAAPKTPVAISPLQQKRRSTPWIAAVGVCVLGAIALVAFAIYRTHVAAAKMTAAAVADKSIAVLPFDNLSDDKANAFFADGVQDEILTDLAKIADLKVISRTSVMQYKTGVARNLRKIAEELGVAHVLEGSVQRSANKVRVNAQLLDARNDAHLWAQSYDRDLADVFAIQSEIAQTIAAQLQARLTNRERQAIEQAPTTDLVANELFQRARKLQDFGTGAGYLQAIGLLEEAVRRDPKFAVAYTALSEVHGSLYWEGIDHTVGRREQARIALQKAQELQPDVGDVHLAAGVYAYHGFRDYEGARKELEAALRALPNHSSVFMITAAVDRRQGRWDDSMRHFDRAVELDPLNVTNLRESAFTRGSVGRYDEARPLLQRALAINPTDVYMRVQISKLDFYRNADVSAWRDEMNRIVAEGSQSASQAALWRVECALALRDERAAAAALAAMPEAGVENPWDNSLIPREWFAGVVARTFGKTEEARAAFTRARAFAVKKVEEQPDYAAAWSFLGLCDAGSSRKGDAIIEGRRACELLPIAKDAIDGAVLLSNLAQIYAWCDEKDLAVQALVEAAKTPGGVTFGELKLMPQWDPLRNDRRFEEFVASTRPK